MLVSTELLVDSCSFQHGNLCRRLLQQFLSSPLHIFRNALPCPMLLLQAAFQDSSGSNGQALRRAPSGTHWCMSSWPYLLALFIQLSILCIFKLLSSCLLTGLHSEHWIEFLISC